jgi:hypothetical protein
MKAPLRLLLAAAFLASPTLATPPLYWVEEDRISVTVRPLNVERADAEAPTTVLQVPERGAETTLELHWPSPGEVTRVRLAIAPRPATAGAPHVLAFEAAVELPDGGRIRSQREVRFEDSTTALYDVCRVGERVLTLALVAEWSRESTLSAKRSVGAPVQLHLEVQRLAGGEAISLETNRLNTFVGEPVTYSFRLGEPGVADALRVRLLPTGVFGDLARIEIEVSGTLPDGASVALLSRSEAWMTSRGATSALSVATGEPPTGFRFLVTPYF